MSTEVEVTRLPKCDICHHDEQVVTDATYDGKTKRGPWANMCDRHFKSDGIGLGTGRGQRLVLRP